MSYKYIAIQSLGIIGSLFYLMSYQFKNNKTLFRIQFVSLLFYSLHFFLLGAYTGALCNLAAVLRTYCLSSNNEKLHSVTACVIICIIQISVGFIAFQGLIGFLPVIANVSLILTGYSDNPKWIRFAGIFINSPLWIIYDIIVGSWAGVIDELITEASIIISVFRFGFNKKVK